MKLSKLTITVLNQAIAELTYVRDIIVDRKVKQHMKKMNNSSLTLNSTRDK